MNDIVLAETAMVSELKELWLRCFSDTAEEIDYFFKHRFRPEECLVVCSERRIQAMVFLLPAALQGSDRRACYVYAFAVHPKEQGRGIATALLREVLHRNRAAGRLTLLCPAEASLEGFYEKRGFYPAYYVRMAEGELRKPLQGREEERMGVKLWLEPCSPAEYAQIRAKCLRHGDIMWDSAAVEYAVNENAFSGGCSLKLILPGGAAGCIMARRSENTLRLREVLLPEGCNISLLQTAECTAALLEKMTEQLTGWQAVLPPGHSFTTKSSRVLYGMADEPIRHGYLNLVLD